MRGGRVAGVRTAAGTVHVAFAHPGGGVPRRARGQRRPRRAARGQHRPSGAGPCQG
ncbi:hypothetical protein SXIM_06420 [Streptomyces xiamenensis]|uniref:Uncharacterized protein n=1 Tax=Streptomyces xiamenensis TaxID=408015 RepID=A0A0F7CMZ6_9ACTN|nr:hypothetical protein SXIM_06420 [Streptomyces xiamenensis]